MGGWSGVFVMAFARRHDEDRGIRFRNREWTAWMIVALRLVRVEGGDVWGVVSGEW